MTRGLRWKAACCLLLTSFVIACTATESNYSGPEQPLVAFEFTPVPTATNDFQTNDDSANALDTDVFTIQIENVVIESEGPAVQMVESAETSPLTTAPSVNVNTTQTDIRTPIASQADRETLGSQILASRNAISNLTYTINVGNGVGLLSCLEVTRYYQDVLEFQQFDVSAELSFANNSYNQALNSTVYGVAPLFSFCTDFLNQSALNDSININDIQPATIWNAAVQESNAAIRSAENAIGWLKGQARLLRTLYDQVDAQYLQLSNLLNGASTTSCERIRQEYERIVMQAAFLDLGNDIQNFSSYNKYTQAVHTLDAAMRPLYEYCDPAVGGLGQLTDSGVDMMFNELVSNAFTGIQEANELMGLADFYITPPTTEPSTANSIRDSAETSSPPPESSEQTHHLKVFVISIQQAAQANLWEMVIGFEATDGVAPFTLLSSGVLSSNNTIMIAESCDQNFHDTIVLRDGNGQRYQSDLIEVKRSGVCR